MPNLTSCDFFFPFGGVFVVEESFGITLARLEVAYVDQASLCLLEMLG